MKSKLILILIVLLSYKSTLSQNNYSQKQITFNKNNQLDITNSLEIYEIDEKQLNQLLNQSKMDFKIVYTFAVWCRPCIEYLPTLLDFINKSDNIELVILMSERDNSTNLYRSINYFKNKNFEKPIFNISDSYSARRLKRYDNFIQSIVPGHKEYGYSLNILYNENNEVIYASTYNESGEEIIKKLAQFIKK